MESTVSSPSQVKVHTKLFHLDAVILPWLSDAGLA